MSPHDTQQIVPVEVGGRRVGPEEPTFLMAEAGVNHDGSVESAIRMVDAAAEAGADAIKFQMFRAADLVTATASTARYQQQGSGESTQQAMLSRLELSQAAFRRIRRRCDERSILFLATPFCEKGVRALVELGAAAIKIASSDLTNGPLLQAAVSADLPIILSTGASTSEEIDSSVRRFHSGAASGRIVLLHCVSCYPTPIEAIHLGAIAALQRCFGVPCGLSDHTLSIQTGGWAVAAGASVLEKHFTLDRGACGPDHAMSLEPSQLRDYFTTARSAKRALGAGGYGMAEIEAEVRAVARRSVVAATDIPAGAQVTGRMLVLKRPGTGIGPGDLGRVVGRRTVVEIPADTLLSWDMVE